MPATFDHEPFSARRTSPPLAQPAEFAGELERFRERFLLAPYGHGRHFFEDYLPALRLGFEARRRFSAYPFDEIAPHLEAEWYATQTSTALTWQQVRPAAHDAWRRRDELERAVSYSAGLS
jgi:hypothetical protein